MSSSVVKISEFSTSNVTFTPMKVLESGGKMCGIKYRGENLTTQLSTLTLPYGMNVFDKAGPVKYSMDLSLRGADENPKVRAVLDAFTALDEFMIDQGVKNSKSWFKADLSRDVVKAFYTPMVKIAKDAEGNPKPYPPTIKINLRKVNDAFEVKVYDDQRRPYEGVPIEDLLVKGAQLTALIQCTSVWFAGSKFGLSWKALQVRMDKVPDSIRGYAFVDDEDSPAPRKSVAPITVPTNSFSALDEEDAEDDDAFAAPAPVKKLTQTTIVPPRTMDDEPADKEPIPVPKKTTVTKKVITKAAKNTA
jgi:hypothetical protein